MFRVESIDHVALLVRDVEGAARWYEEVLGLERRYQDVWGSFPAVVGKGGTSLALFPVTSLNPIPPPGRDTLCVRHIAFRVDHSNFLADEARSIAAHQDGDHYEPDEWSPHGEKITSEANLALIREAADQGGIVVRHWHYRAARSPDIRGFSDFEEFESYVARYGVAGDAFDVWAFAETCDFDRVLAKGKLPDPNGAVPRRGAY